MAFDTVPRTWSSANVVRTGHGGNRRGLCHGGTAGAHGADGPDRALRSPGAGQLACHLGALLATGALVWSARSSLWLLSAMLLHGIALVFLFAPLHESVHWTAFRSRRLNDVKQTLAAGVHGLLLCHPETPDAARAFVEAARYPFHAAIDGVGVGRRGSGGQELAAAIWGISPLEYLDRADVWPLNPMGELLLGLNIENRRALANAEASAAVPGLALAEGTPRRTGFLE